MPKTQNKIVIPIGERLSGEYLADLHEAISEVNMLAFGRRELDLQEPQCFAFYMLADFQKRIVATSYQLK